MNLTPLKAIRAKCLDCCCDQSNEVRLCPCKSCTLWPFRFGKNPNRAGIGNGGNFTKNTHSMRDSERATATGDSSIPQDLDGEKEG